MSIVVVIESIVQVHIIAPRSYFLMPRRRPSGKLSFTEHLGLTPVNMIYN